MVQDFEVGEMLRGVVGDLPVSESHAEIWRLPTFIFAETR
jgi:hypothetical protein